MEIKYFEVKGLFGEVDVAIPIRDNKLVLVGYNGIGKSTILNLFYYLISRQWKKIIDQEFYSICIQISDLDEIEVLRTDILKYTEIQMDRRQIIGRGKYSKFAFDQILRYITKNFPEHSSEGSHVRDRSILRSQRFQAVEDIASTFSLSMSAADELYSEYVTRSKSDLSLFDEAISVVQKLDTVIADQLNGRILYLPTYRRIERDVKDVFPEFEDEIRRKLQTRRGRKSVGAHIELVEFGMDDVIHKIKQRLENIRGYALSQVNNLTGRYLRDVIRDRASDFSSEITQVDQAALDAVLEKIDDQTLTEEDKKSLYGVVEKINAGIRLENNENYIAHYVTCLTEVGMNISQLERSVQHFASVCNSYLYGKHFLLDNKDYRLVIKRDSGGDVDLEQLSSGEKQIVSLFSHLLLDDVEVNYVIIDEPELSLSVDWQQRFLEDISNMKSCELIFAVTHSPFVYENELDDYAVDFFECEVPRG